METMELKLVPLSQALIPPAVAQAFGLNSALGGTFAISSSSLVPPLEGVVLRTPAGPADTAPAAPASLPTQTAPASAPASVATTARAPAWPSTPYTSMPGPSGMPQQPQMSLSNLSAAPTTSTGAAGPPYGSYPMYVAFSHGAPPPYASALPGVFGSMPYAYPYSHGMPAGSVDLSGGPTSSGPQGYGMRLGPGMPSTITDSADDDPGDGTARAVKRARLVWTPQLHKRFEEAVNKLGPEKSIPKNIMQEMNVEGLTRENVASHLQKWRLQKKVGSSTKDGPDGGDVPGFHASAAAVATSQGASDMAHGRAHEQQHSHGSAEAARA